MNSADDHGHPAPKWRRIVRSDQLPAGTIVEIDDGDKQIVWRAETGEVTACEARCPHLFSHFAVDGYVSGQHLVCAAHGWRFAVDGTASDRNDEPMRAVRVWPTRVNENYIEVLINETNETNEAAADSG